MNIFCDEKILANIFFWKNPICPYFKYWIFDKNYKYTLFLCITFLTKIINILIIFLIMKDIIYPNVEIPDDQVAMAFFRSVRWVNGVYCPKCRSYNINNRGNQGRTRRYVCKDCGANFNDFSGTIFHKSKIPLNVMLYMLFNLDKKTTTQLSEELDYSRQCISRISKLFREKLLSNPEFFDMED